MVDGEFRRGTDVMKALALGAHFVFAGRPFLYAATVAGLPGIMKAAEISKRNFIGIWRSSAFRQLMSSPASILCAWHNAR